MKITALACCLGALLFLGCRSADPAVADALPTGIDWVLTTLTDGGDASPLPTDEPPTLRFDEEAEETRVSGFAGVNRFMGSCTVGPDGALGFSPLGSTMMAGPPERMELEQRFLAQLQAAESFTTDGKRLEIRTETGSLVFRSE